MTAYLLPIGKTSSAFETFFLKSLFTADDLRDLVTVRLSVSLNSCLKDILITEILRYTVVSKFHKEKSLRKVSRNR